MGSSAGFKPILRAAVAAGCLGALPFEGALAQTHVTMAAPAPLTAAEASMQGGESR